MIGMFVIDNEQSVVMNGSFKRSSSSLGKIVFPSLSYGASYIGFDIAKVCLWPPNTALIPSFLKSLLIL